MVGVASSFVAWLIVVVLLRPRLTWERNPMRQSTYDGQVWNHAYLRNRRPWRAMDVHVVCRLRVKGLYQNYPQKWATYELPLDDDYVPVLPGTLSSRRRNAGRVKTVFTGGARQGFRISVDQLPQRLLDDVGHRTAERLRTGSTTCYDLVQLGQYAELSFIAMATDGFSGTRMAFPSPQWNRMSIGPERAALHPESVTMESNL